MAYAETPMTPRIQEAVEAAWNIPAAHGVRLPGGEESTSYRVGRHVVRIGPDWRTDAELEWCYAIAARAATEVPEVTAPLAASDGRHIVRVEDRPVSVWPYAEGSWADGTDAGQQAQAADLLARLHRCFASMTGLPPRPSSAARIWQGAPHPDVDDPDLDRWLADFRQHRPRRQPLHGDVYRANVLVRDGRIVALINWDDVSLGPPEQELAEAAGEWGGVRRSVDLNAAMRFVDAYVAAGGPAARIDADELAQLVRGRIRMEVTYSHATGQWGASEDPEELEYEARQLTAFRELRP